MSSIFRQQLESHLKTIDVSGRVLDIGGSQMALKGRTKSWGPKEYKVLDVENRGEEVDYLLDIQKESDITLRRDEVFWGKCVLKQFDMVFCLEVMEYLIDPFQAVKNMARLCRSGGTLIISFPFVYPLHPPHGKDFMRYTKYGAIELLQRNHFKVQQYMPRTFNGIKEWNQLLRSEGYKFDRAESEDTLNENGCLIIATKI
jgi:SAM-dependent methyltransferase